MEIEEIRSKLDKIDKELVRLIAERVALIPAIGEYKKKNNLPMHNPEREKQIFESKRKIAEELCVNPDLVEDIFKRLIRESYRIEEEILAKK